MTINDKPAFVFVGEQFEPNYPELPLAKGFVRLTWDGAVEQVTQSTLQKLPPSWFEPIDKSAIGCWAYDNTGKIVYGIVLYHGDYLQKHEKPHYCVVIQQKGASHLSPSVPAQMFVE